MPKLIIDHRELEVPEGTKVIEAAQKLGIMIPRFCFHPALGSVGACRVCAVKFIQGPLKGVQMSCMIDAQDGMVVSTTDPEAMDFRKAVIEWLMLNHPHDCPVCDEGGHCLLQDTTVSGGHGLRRFRGRKRTHTDQYLGPLVQHEMNRCIQCYRCTRYYREFSGYGDLGVMGVAARVYFGRYKEGPLESPFAGNLIDVCPTGVYTDKPSRFKGRRWDFERSPSLCIHCSLGCHTVVSARYREIVRQEARYSDAVNGHFICDRGRYGFYYASLPDRPRNGTIDAQEVPAEEALQAAVDRLTRLEASSGPGAVAAVGSLRSSFETQAMLWHTCRRKGWQGPAFWTDRNQSRTVNTAVTRLDKHLATSLGQLEDADCILVIAADPLNEAPMTVMAMRQAQRNGAIIVVIDPRPTSLPFNFIHLAATPQDIGSLISGLIKQTIDLKAAQSLGDNAVAFYHNTAEARLSEPDVLVDVVQSLSISQRPVILCGSDIVSNSTLVNLAADYAHLLNAAGKHAGLFFLLPGANAFGAALLPGSRASVDQILANIENGDTRALLIVENDPLQEFPDRNRLKSALNKLDLLITLDYVNSASLQAAHISIPTTTIFETGGIFLNQEGRAQQCPGTYHGGLPVSQVGHGDHPPRVFRRGAPGQDITTAWQVLADLTAVPGDRTGEAGMPAWLSTVKDIDPAFSAFSRPDTIPEEGVRIETAIQNGSHFGYNVSDDRIPASEQADGFHLMLVNRTFGTEALSALSPSLNQLDNRPCLWMHSQDAVDLGLSNGDGVAIELENGELALALCVFDNMAPGTLFLPRDPSIDWQALGAPAVQLAKNRIRKTSG